MENYKAKFTCSYGGDIQPPTSDKPLSYVGGDTKLLLVDSKIKFPAMLSKLSALCGDPTVLSFKYHLPGEDFDHALISVTNDDDLDLMMLEYDQLHRASATPARMRLFLFPNPSHHSGPASPQPDPYKSNPSVDFLDVPRQLQFPASGLFGPLTAATSFNSSPTLVNVNANLEAVRINGDDLGCASSSSSLARPPSPPPQVAVSTSSRFIDPFTLRKYDVFISFRGEDTRANFVSHLRKTLSEKQIISFIDHELDKGDEISPSLSEAIEDSSVSVVVFSKNYADSKFCLEELVKILQCREERGQTVIPVFYGVDPSHLRKLIGTYKEAFEKHMNNSMLDKNRVQSWKDALAKAADLGGWDSRSRYYSNDAELIQRIVEDIMQKLISHHPPNDFNKRDLVGKNRERVECLLKEARSVGIWGTAGIGKTIIARYIFDKYSHQYEGSCFLEDVRGKSGERGQWLHGLRNQLHSELLQNKIGQDPSMNKHMLQRQRNLIVLDDVSSSQQLEWLVGELHSYGLGSTIIVTSRDKNVLENRRVEKIHEVEELELLESLQLFGTNTLNALRKRIFKKF